MEIITTKDGKTLMYDNGAVSVVDVKSLKSEKEGLEERIALDIVPDDKKLLEWAKNNYPMVDHSAEIKRLEQINIILSLING